MSKIDQSLRSFKKIALGQTFDFIFVLKTLCIVLIETKIKKKIHQKRLEKKILLWDFGTRFGWRWY